MEIDVKDNKEDFKISDLVKKADDKKSLSELVSDRLIELYKPKEEKKK